MYLDRLSLRPSYMASSVWVPMLCGVCLYGKWRVQHGARHPDKIMGALREEQPSGSLSQVSGVTVPDFRLLASRAAAALLSFRLRHLWYFNLFLGPV